MTGWVFRDPPNVGVYTTRSVVRGGAWIALVTHDEDDGIWQFHDDTPDPARVVDGLIVCLADMVARDPTSNELADLSEGWRAWRDRPDEPWQRMRFAGQKPLDQAFSQVGKTLSGRLVAGAGTRPA